MKAREHIGRTINKNARLAQNEYLYIQRGCLIYNKSTTTKVALVIMEVKMLTERKRFSPRYFPKGGKGICEICKNCSGLQIDQPLFGHSLTVSQ